MTRHTLKILRCSHRKVFKYVWPFYNIMHERVKRPNLVMIFKLLDNIIDCIIRIASRLFDKMYFQECFHYIWKTLFKLTRCYNNVFNIWSLVFFVKKFTFYRENPCWLFFSRKSYFKLLYFCGFTSWLDKLT